MSQTENRLDGTAIAEIKQQCYAVIDRFMHRPVLREDDIRAWVNHVVGEHGEQAVWHATRAGGFGGSDIGVLVRNFQGYRADHQASAHDIIAGKLLLAVPSEENGHLQRGHENEERHALRYSSKYGAQRDVAAFDKLSKAQGIRPWMRYSPDEVALYPSTESNPALGGLKAYRVLVDYKAPSQVDQSAGIAFQYSCQLHQGAIICAAHDIHLDALQLSQYDWANWALKDDYVTYDPELAQLIVTAGDHFFDYVMRGELPDYVRTPKFAESEEFARRFGERAQVLAQMLAVSKAMEAEVKVRSEELKTIMAEVAGEKGLRLAGSRLVMGDLNVSGVTLVDHNALAKVVPVEDMPLLRKAKPGKDVSYDTAAMAAKLTELGIDPNKYRTDKFDADAAFEYLADRQLDPQAFMKEQIRLAPSKFMKEQAAEMVAETYPRMREVVAEVTTDGADMDQAANVEATEVVQYDAAELDVRDGQSTERLAQRTAMV